MKKICVFCGSSMGTDPIYRQKAEELADYLIQHDMTLVYGGANVGLMKILADKMLAAGKEVIGIMPHHLIEKEVAHTELTEMIAVDSMAERKDIMIEMSDAFIALPGGFGTLDEVAEVLVLDQLHIIEKPMGLLDVKDYFSHLVKFFELGVGEGFIRQEHLDNLLVDSDTEMLMNKLSDYKPITMTKWLKDIKKESK
ncbi:TIGR00730 family Rossman fold protein [Lentimicrobium sp. L6]|uniref:LOG family protein n=1 Tax=Lentimicrobium sp. L6 TaxID=2735916 RepID=UPI0015517859|nr:TIGR00730 family Rossman fold protein [Lentimicrobium sp. L6]NPD86907.1 TIGR00730 family Rossman fold protein [Lentimicrobium sp. L6]